MRSGFMMMMIVLLLAACSSTAPLVTEEVAEPTATIGPTDTAIPPTDAPPTDVPATSTPVPTADPATLLIPPDIPGGEAQECPFISADAFAEIVGAPVTSVSAIRTFRPDGSEAPIVCTFEAGDRIALEILYYEIDPAAALTDFAQIRDLSAHVPVDGLADGALWWPLGLHFRALHRNAHISVNFSQPRPDAPAIGSRVVAAALPTIDPELDEVMAPAITVPPNLPKAEPGVPLEFGRPTGLGDPFELCAFFPEETLTDLLGPLSGPPLSGADIGEGVGPITTCQIQTEAGGFMYVTAQFSDFRANLLVDALRLSDEGEFVDSVGQIAVVTTPDEFSTTLTVTERNVLLTIPYNGPPEPEVEDETLITLAQTALETMFGK